MRTEANDAAACQKNNAQDVSKVIDLLKNLGIAENSIQTSDYYMYPVYNYSGSTSRITGYEATASLTVSNIPIDDLGNILEQSDNALSSRMRSLSDSTGISNEESFTSVMPGEVDIEVSITVEYSILY